MTGRLGRSIRGPYAAGNGAAIAIGPAPAFSYIAAHHAAAAAC
jgi:hypothetical protein